MAVVANLTAAGLQLSNNRLNTVEGALTQAENVVIRRDNVIESRRGYKLYGDAISTSGIRAKQLRVYRDRLLRHYNSTLQHDDGTGTFTSFTGSYSEAETNVRMKSIESNGNLYFTSSEGIKKISAASSTDFPNLSITNSGGIKALDFTTETNYEYGDISGFLPKDSMCAYRILWATKDLNSNLVQGSPSARVEAYNPFQELINQDFNYLLKVLDDTSNLGTGIISDGNYSTTYHCNLTELSTTLYSYLQAICTKLDTDILYADDNSTPANAPLTISDMVRSSNIVTVSFGSDPTDYFVAGSKISVTNPSDTTYSGTFTIISVDGVGNTITYNQTAADDAGGNIGSSTIHSYEYRTISATYTTAPVVPTTNAMWQTLQEFIDDIIVRLQSEPTAVIGTGASVFINTLTLTDNSTVTLNIQIPDDITDSYFLQIYRSEIAQATGTTVFDDLAVTDELQLIYEAYPSQAELLAGEMIVEDDTPDAFRGSYLYTNQATGEGILQANDSPPFAVDINRFKGYTFYANTKTKHRMNINVLGVSNIIDAIDDSKDVKLILANSTSTQEFQFVKGVKNKTTITTVLDSAGSLNGTYFDLNTLNDKITFRFYYSTGAFSLPGTSGKTEVLINLTAGDAADVVATKTLQTLQLYIKDFNLTIASNQIIVENVAEGKCTAASAGTTGFTFDTVAGVGEDATSDPVKVLVSTEISPSLSTDLTARSLVRMINLSTSNFVLAYYLSSPTDVPGKISLEAKNLSDGQFYASVNISEVGASFNPNLAPLVENKAASLANPTVITSDEHGLVTGSTIMVVTPSGSTIVPEITGYYTVTKLNANTFSIPIDVTTGGTISYTKTSDVHYSENEDKVNRIYYSKYYQPEAVPIINYFDVGAEGEDIIRIFPLRDSLFVFKKDGLYRVSGELPPWNVALFDSSCVVVAPDTVDIANNSVYAYTTQGIVNVTESAVEIISRPIDTEILKLFNPNFVNFQSATWGIGYESDNSYTVYTISETSDTYATIAYRYSNLTNTWTTFDKTATCGVIASFDDKQYLGAGDTNYLEQERKTFDRTDYADREIVKTIASSGILGNSQIRLNVVSDVKVGDVIVQSQYVTIDQFNRVLTMLDLDAIVNDSDYVATLFMNTGNNLTNKLQSLAQKLDADTGVQDTDYEASCDFTDTSYLGIKTNYNIIINKLNADLGVAFTTYPLNVTTSTMEMIITAIDNVTKIITTNVQLPIYAGDFTVYESIDCIVKWAPNSMGNLTELKHGREVQAFLESRSITEGILLFNSDLMPVVTRVNVVGDGAGLYGLQTYGTKNYWGGTSNTAPIRTYIPRNYQRFAYLTVGWEHKIAREKWALYGISIIGEVTGSNRAWR